MEFGQNSVFVHLQDRGGGGICGHQRDLVFTKRSDAAKRFDGRRQGLVEDFFGFVGDFYGPEFAAEVIVSRRLFKHFLELVEHQFKALLYVANVAFAISSQLNFCTCE